MSMCIVMTSSKKMPSSCKAAYRRVVVVQLNQEYTAKNMRLAMISSRARGVLRIIDLGHFPANGKTMRSGYQQALAQAEKLAHDMNNHREVAAGELLINAVCA